MQRQDHIKMAWNSSSKYILLSWNSCKGKKKKKNSAYDLTFTVYVPLCNNNNNKKKIPNITINPLMYCSETAYWCSID